MFVKVCGNNDLESIEQLSDCPLIDALGFVFYTKSPRNLTIELGVKQKKRIGVFVDHSVSQIKALAEKYELDEIQLHGDQTLDECQELSKEFSLIKVCSVSNEVDFDKLFAFEPYVRCFLLDTASSEKGGSGKKFDWKLLHHYPLNKPFILSGGINENDVDEIVHLKHPAFHGIDINSCFEISPGKKDCNKTIAFIKKLKR